MVSLYTSMMFGGLFAFCFVLPSSSWTFVFGTPMPTEAFVVWRASAFAYFMISVFPLGLAPHWYVYAWMLFFWPLNLLLVHAHLALFDWMPRAFMLVAPLHHFVGLFPIMLIDASTID